MLKSLKTEAYFDAAHFLSDYDGKCKNLHGHRWHVVVYLTAEELHAGGALRGMVLDFADFEREVQGLADSLDHSFIVEERSLKPKTLACLESEGFTLTTLPFRTTAENIARWFAEQLESRGLPVSQVELYETPNNCAIYYKE